MKLLVREDASLEGSGRVIIALAENAPWVPAVGEAVRVQHGKRLCGAWVQAIKQGQGLIEMDKYLRLHLQVREGQAVTVEPLTSPDAEVAEVRVPPSWAQEEGLRLLGRFLMGRLASAGAKIPFFTLGGSTVLVEIVAVTPGPIARLAAKTAFRLATEKGAASGQAAGVGYADIGGLSRELQRIRELVEYPLRAPEAFAYLGIEMPRGIILHGPPGTGKTLIAKALSNEVGAQFFSVRGPEILSAFFGESERHLRDLFERARAAAPAVILIDELDALAPKREQTQGETERRLVATLLSLMDGLTDMRGVVVIGTTNRLNALDPALRRPGRFEHEIHIGPPDVSGRREILAIHVRRMPLADDVNLDDLAQRTPGFVGADLASLCREAGYNALRHRHSPQALEAGEIDLDDTLRVSMADFSAALNTLRPSALREVTVQVPRHITFDQVGGLEEVKRLIIEAVSLAMTKPQAYRCAGIRPARGLLLYGPPGTGKTLLAYAAANHCGANLVAVRGPEVFSKWFGESEERIRFVFAKAREVAPSIILFDEIDAIASARGRETQYVAGESIVNQLLAEMDAMEGQENVFIIAATNQANLLDPALLRPGRFDLQIEVPLPDEAAREAIFAVHLKPMPLEEGFSATALARRTEGFSGADIAEVCRRAALHALREVA
ncbi:MAG: AAA family ATPase, partial [Chloroflexi bacterium]|nr:AAA family ATPase [Chloroflexota bacterium]